MIAFMFDFLLKNYSEETKPITKAKQFIQLQKQATHYLSNLHLSPVNIQEYKLIEYIDTINRDVKKDLEDYLVLNQLQNFVTNIIEKILINESSNPFLSMAEILLTEYTSDLLIIFMIKANNNSTKISNTTEKSESVNSSNTLSSSSDIEPIASNTQKLAPAVIPTETIDDQYNKANESYLDDNTLFDIDDVDKELEKELLVSPSNPSAQLIPQVASSNPTSPSASVPSSPKKENNPRKNVHNIYDNSDDSLSEDEANTIEDDEMEDFKAMYQTSNPSLLEQRIKNFAIVKRKFSVSSESISCEDALIELKKRIKDHKYNNGIYIKKSKNNSESKGEDYEDNDDDYEVNEALYEKILRLVSNVPYVDSILTLEEKNYLVKIIQGPQTYYSNDIIIKSTEINNNFYIIEEGKIEIIKDKKALKTQKFASKKHESTNDLDSQKSLDDLNTPEQLNEEGNQEDNINEETNENQVNNNENENESENDNENEEDDGNSEVQLKILGSGDVFNHLSLLYPTKSNETYRVLSKTAILWKVDRLGFRSLILAGIYRKRLEIKEKIKKFNILSYKNINLLPENLPNNINLSNKKEIKLYTTNELNFIHDNIVIRKYKKNDIIFKENESNTKNIYFLYQGTLSFYQRVSTINNIAALSAQKNQPYGSNTTPQTPTQQLKKIKTISSGAYFGDYELFNSLNHQYSVIVESHKNIDDNSTKSEESEDPEEAIVLVLSSYHLFNFLPLLQAMLKENASNNFNENMNTNI